MARRRRALWEALLEHAGPRVPAHKWPKSTTHEFYRMSGGLQQAVESAVGRATNGCNVSDWEWNPHERWFQFLVRLVIASDVTDTVVTSTSRFYFDPRKAWVDEVERVMIKTEAYARKLRAALRKDP